MATKTKSSSHPSIQKILKDMENFSDKKEMIKYLTDMDVSVMNSVTKYTKDIQMVLDSPNSATLSPDLITSYTNHINALNMMLSMCFEIFEGQLKSTGGSPVDQLAGAISNGGEQKWDGFLDYLRTPGDFLTDRLDDTESQEAFASFIKSNWVKEWDIHLSELEKKIKPLENPQHVQKIKEDFKIYCNDDVDFFSKFSMMLDQKLIEGLAPEYQKLWERLTTEAKKAAQEQDIAWDAASIKKEGIKIIETITTKGLTGDAVAIVQKSFEEFFDGQVSMVIAAVIQGIFAEKLQNCEDISEVNGVVSSDMGKKITDKINILMGEESKKMMEKLMNDTIKERILEVKSNTPRLKNINNMLQVGRHQFPVFHSMTKKGPPVQWERAPGSKEGVYAHHMKEEISGKTWEVPTRLMEDSEYMSDESFKAFKEKNKEYQMYMSSEFPKDSADIQAMRQKITEIQQKQQTKNSETDNQEPIELSDADKQEVSELKIKVAELIKKSKKKMPKIIRYVNLLNAYQRQLPFASKYLTNEQKGVQTAGNIGKIPDFDPNKIKITEHTIEIMEKIVRGMESQMIRQDGITILEGEAGVGKNVYIDTLGHFLKRPVFIFACNRQTDKQDLTFAYEIDKDGTYHVPSIVYEAIMTPGAILVFDEINTLPEDVIKKLNPLFDYRRELKMPHVNGKEKADPSVLIFGTMNPKGYAGVLPLPQDTASRAEFILAPYEPIMTSYTKKFDSVLGNVEPADLKDIDLTDNTINYPTGEALKMRGNINFFWKLRTPSGWTKKQVFEREKVKLKQANNHKLSDEEKKILEDFPNKHITDQEFNWARNECFNSNNEQEVVDKYGAIFVEGMKDIFTLVIYGNYIRLRYKANKETRNEEDSPWGQSDMTFPISASPRLLYQMLFHIHHGDHPKKAFLEIYTGQISDQAEKKKILDFLKNKPLDEMIHELKEIHITPFINDTDADA